MSLTSELRSKNSWVNQFFKNNFANVVDFTKKEGASIKAMPTIVPTSSDVPARRRMGTALDYRLRMHLGADPQDSSVINQGIEWMETLRPDSFVELTGTERFAWAKSMRALIKEINEQPESELSKISVILAQINDGFRSGGVWSEDMKKAAREIVTKSLSARWEDITKHVPQEESAEIEALVELAKELFGRENIKTVVFGPTFSGSFYVGGADADIIVDGCLYDVKTSSNPRGELAAAIRQIIGYALLDWNDEYKLDRMGLYLSRQGKAISWSTDEIIKATASYPRATLHEMRNEFRSWAEAWQVTCLNRYGEFMRSVSRHSHVDYSDKNNLGPLGVGGGEWTQWQHTNTKLRQSAIMLRKLLNHRVWFRGITIDQTGLDTGQLIVFVNGKKKEEQQSIPGSWEGFTVSTRRTSTPLPTGTYT